MSDSKTTPSESDILDWLQELGTGFPPVLIRLISRGPVQISPQKRVNTDAIVDVSWQNQTFRFAAELKSLSTPKAIQAAIDQAKSYARVLKVAPLVVTPYLSEDNLTRLELEKASGLDLCGNGLLQVPGRLMVRRSGEPNNYPRGAKIQNVYRGISSLVSRTFLLRPEYETAQNLLAEIWSRGAKATASTVSKVCSALAEDLIIERERKQQSTQLRLIQPEKLLGALAKNFEPVRIQKRLIGQCSLMDRDLLNALVDWQKKGNQKIVRTGVASTDEYATMLREPIARFYCTGLASLAKYLGSALTETSRFPSVEFSETQDATVYFDMRDALSASPIQCYLELQAGDKREQETATQVRNTLLKGLPNRNSRA